MKKLRKVVDNEVVKNKKFNTLKTKVNKLEKKIPNATTLIHINQCNTDKQNLEKRIGYFDQKTLDTSDLVTATVLNESKIPDHAKYITT